VGHSGLIYTLDVAMVRSSEIDLLKLIAFTGGLDETVKVWDLTTSKCLDTWTIRRPYEGMKIDKMQGLTNAQQATLQALGAVTAIGRQS
jgi:WD40 repeat protein